MDRRLNAEQIMRVTVSGLDSFLHSQLSAEYFEKYTAEKDRMFPTWDHLWVKLKFWLSQEPLANKQDTVLNFAQIFPHIEPYKPQLINSLALHDSFWNQVFENLVIAKTRL
ncbi:uncharacterized protein TNIN_118451 [Trichonephila inaurata madagascariensis]|uniref:Uncharacterized protein n=1 Tax=Trichonephila inaurata madagascariensis TaxID=2747483 RepID=A0A8X6IIC9_9ARAC|nr:uncharacterized protein TNIN_118451 [Trichonephila inaurata madagascariensis]